MTAPMLKERTHFARLNTTIQVRQSLHMLAGVCDVPLSNLTTGSIKEGHLTVKAPDGDIVFQALKKGAADAWMCRFHREVFEE